MPAQIAAQEKEENPAAAIFFNRFAMASAVLLSDRFTQ
jgi:hypothetical protein